MIGQPVERGDRADVNPVAINSVVYVRSRAARPNNAEVGHTARTFVAIFTPNSRAITPAPATSAGKEINSPARRIADDAVVLQGKS